MTDSCLEPGAANWRMPQASHRRQWLERFDAQQASEYHEMLGVFDAQELEAWTADLVEACPALSRSEPFDCLDLGAGSGAMSQLLCALGPHRVNALEPVPAMLDLLRSRPELASVQTRSGFCDHESDRAHYPGDSFDFMVGRQIANGLYDPVTAFRNARYWLRPSGKLLLIDGWYTRQAWQGVWESEVDQLPLSANQSVALVPYLLELSGFVVDWAGMMGRVNLLPRTRTPRYLVVASKPNAG